MISMSAYWVERAEEIERIVRIQQHAQLVEKEPEASSQ